jgi:tyrosine-protein kinase Etk/Wzc
MSWVGALESVPVHIFEHFVVQAFRVIIANPPVLRQQGTITRTVHIVANDVTNETLRPIQVAVPQPVQPEEDEVNLRELYELLYSGRWTILAIALAVLVAGALYCVLVLPTYEANGLVQVEETSNSSGSMSSLSQISSLLLGSPVQTEAEIQILQSRLVLDQVIQSLNLEIEAYPKHFPIIGSAIARFNSELDHPAAAPWGLRRWAWGGEQIAVTRFEVPEQLLDLRFTLTATPAGFALEDPHGDEVLTGTPGQAAQSKDGRIQIFVQKLVAAPGTRFAVIRHAHQTVLTQLQAALSVTEQGRQSGVIQLTYRDRNPDRVTAIIDAIENAYLKQNVERQSENAKQSLEFLNRQLPDLKAKLDADQSRLTAYQSQHGAPDVASQTQLLLQQSVDLETQRLQLIQQRDQALQRFTPQHPVIQALNQQIGSVEQAQAKLKQRVSNLPDTQQEILGLLRDVEVDTQLYTAMLNSIQELQVARAGTIGNVRIVDYALKPIEPASPKVPLTLTLALVLGGFLGVVYVFVQRALLRGIDDPTLIERHFGLSVLVSIPYVNEQRKLARTMARDEHGSHVLAMVDSNSQAIEALRSLRTSLHFAMLEAPNNIILVTGPAPNIGKSFVAANFGAVLALTGKRVALVDVDMRRGHLNKYFDLKPKPGVSDYVAGDVGLQDLFQPTGVAGLDFIARGSAPPNPAELLMHERLGELLQELSARYDYVLLDSPPLLAVSDAAIVAKLAGTTLLVLKSAEHPLREIEETLKRLANAGVRPRGVLLNQVGARVGSYGYGNYGYTYYKYKH